MKKLFFSFLIAIFMASALPLQVARAEDAAQSGQGSNSSLPLCLPGIYSEQETDCLALGPSQALSSLAKLGFTFPPRQPAGFNPPADLAVIPYQYIKVTADEASIPLFRSPPEKRDDPAPVYQDPGFKYFSYLNRVENDAGLF
jgi:hypothetical protein